MLSRLIDLEFVIIFGRCLFGAGGLRFEVELSVNFRQSRQSLHLLYSFFADVGGLVVLHRLEIFAQVNHVDLLLVQEGIDGGFINFILADFILITLKRANVKVFFYQIICP